MKPVEVRGFTEGRAALVKFLGGQCFEFRFHSRPRMSRSIYAYIGSVPWFMREFRGTIAYVAEQLLRSQ